MPFTLGFLKYGPPLWTPLNLVGSRPNEWINPTNTARMNGLPAGYLDSAYYDGSFPLDNSLQFYGVPFNEANYYPLWASSNPYAGISFTAGGLLASSPVTGNDSYVYTELSRRDINLYAVFSTLLTSAPANPDDTLRPIFSLVQANNPSNKIVLLGVRHSAGSSMSFVTSASVNGNTAYGDYPLSYSNYYLRNFLVNIRYTTATGNITLGFSSSSGGGFALNAPATGSLAMPLTSPPFPETVNFALGGYTYTFPSGNSGINGYPYGDALDSPLIALKEMIEISNNLSQADEDRVNAYLAWKWGIPISFGYPYHSEPPYAPV